MDQAIPASSACRSVFRGGTEAPTAEAYTQLWITLIDQIERDKQVLSGSR